MNTIEEELAACRKRWEGFPVGTLAHKVHHDLHFERLTEPAESRINWILAKKPEEEIATRLHNFGPFLIGIPQAWEDAEKAMLEADKIWQIANGVWRKARRKSDRRLWEEDKACADASNTCLETGKILQAIGDSWEKTPEFRAEHAKQFPDCTWSGRTIFERWIF